VLAHRTAFDVTSTDPSSAYIVTLDGRYVGTYSSTHVVVSGLRAGVNKITIRALANGLADQTPLLRTVDVPRGVRTMKHTSAWKLRSRDGHLFGYYAQTRTRGQMFRTYSAEIKKIALVVSQGAGYGKVRVYLDGKPITRRAIDLSSAARKSGVLVPVRTFATTRSGVITVKVVSAGKVVRIEGIGVA
jgi:hypothetical protein